MWEPIENPYEFQIKGVVGVQEEKQLVQLNSRALNILLCGLFPLGHNSVMTLRIACDAWKKLEATFQGTSQVKNNKI